MPEVITALMNALDRILRHNENSFPLVVDSLCHLLDEGVWDRYRAVVCSCTNTDHLRCDIIDQLNVMSGETEKTRLFLLLEVKGK